MRTLLIVTTLCFLFSTAVPAQVPVTQWHSVEPELGEERKREILKVIDQAGKVISEHIYTRTVGNDCTEVRIESSKEGNLVLYDLLFMKRRSHGQCPVTAMFVTWPEGTNVPEDALVLKGTATEERRRILGENGWWLDVVLGKGVPLESAASIVRSIRQANYTYELKVGQSGRSVPLTAPFRIELNHTTRITRAYLDPDDQPVYGLETYATRTSGTYSTFVVRGSSVRVLAHNDWVH
jgi:hypothetical protein